ncbi:MAG: hypothetical protein DCC58_03040 [Chloroflexi bacterium]|nr:MAG: hypothetical protein DCC58_03040 [Chloroflexota bacterium]
MATILRERDWQVRLYIYQFLVAHTHPPTTAEAAQHFGLPEADARAAYQRLHDAHALFLQPGTTNVRMANPISAVETAYPVTVSGRTLFANCAWDSLGIPAMLGADARIDTLYTGTDIPARYAIEAGELRGDDGLVHFPLPFRHWYDNLIHT